MFITLTIAVYCAGVNKISKMCVGCNIINKTVNLFTAVTNNTANVRIACYGRAVGGIGNMRVAKRRTDNAAYHAAAGNAATNKRNVIDIGIMRNTK